jgi:nicotinate-nucleotide adenylyltransferase
MTHEPTDSPSTKRKIGILGGTFDPPHLTHLALARAAMEQLQLDEVIFIPAARNPLKTSTTGVSAKRRMAMVKLMLTDEENMSVSDIELSRQGPSYTVDTLQELQFANPGNYWFILGSDAASSLASWKTPEKLAKYCRFAIALRPPHDKSTLRRYVPELVQPHCDLIEFKSSQLSATLIRQNIERGLDEEHHLHPDVWKYIKENKLYART